MSLSRYVLFWLGALAVAILGLWLLSGILLPFVAGMALAYLLDPVADRLERWGVSRLVATLAIIGLFVLLFVVLILLIVPLLGNQLAAFIENLPGYVSRVRMLLVQVEIPWLQRVIGLPNSDQSIAELVTQGAGWLTAFLRSLWSGGQALISLFSLLVVTPVVAFYLLYDWDHMVSAVDSWLPRPYRDTIRQLAREMNDAISGFVRGQTAICLILGSFYAVGLTLAGLNFGFLIGMVAGLISFIPYVGSMTGLILSVGVAIAQFWPEWSSVLVVIGIFFAGQFFEGNVLQPKLLGSSIGLHPVWVMFALFAFGYLFGFVGLLLAVPLAAAIAVLARFALRRYLESPLYSGVPTSGSLEPPRVRSREERL